MTRKRVRNAVFVDEFTVGLEDLKRKDAGNLAKVLAILKRTGRFSVFEATANETIGNTMTALCRSEWLESLGGAYPWTNVRVTPAGEEFLRKCGC